MIPYGKQEISEEDIEAVAKVLRSDYLTQGPAVTSFEKAICKAVGAKEAVAVSNGTTALHLALLALGVRPGDAVFVPAITFAATANAVLYCGATPVFVDVEPRTGLLCRDSLEKGITLAKEKGLRPRAVCPVDLAGRPSVSSNLVEKCQHHDLYILNDACHSLGAQASFGNGGLNPVGSSDSVHAVVFSFHPVKHITTGEGGAVVTPSKALAEKIRCLASHGITKQASHFTETNQACDPSGTPNPWYHEMQFLGFNFRMCDIVAALGENQVKRLSNFIERRRKLAEFYRQELKGWQAVQCSPKENKESHHAYHLFPLRVDFDVLGKSRAIVMNELRDQGIQTQVHYLPVPWHPYYKREAKHLCMKLPGAEEYYKTTLSIPMYPGLWEKGKEDVVKALRKVLGS